MQALFPHQDEIVAVLQASLPACQDGHARVHGCRPVDVVTGRRGKVFALASADVSEGAATAATRRFVIHAYPAGAEEEGRKVFRRIRRMARAMGTAGALSPWAAYLPERRWLVVPFPFDYRLPHLTQMCEPEAVTDALRSAGVVATVRSVTPVRYVPEKRCQMRFDVEVGAGTKGVFFGKTMASDNGADVVRVMGQLHAHFATSATAGTPPPVAHLPQWQTVVQRGVGGETLYDLQRAGNVADAVYRQAGHALAELHDADLNDLGMHGRLEECALLGAMLDKRVLTDRDEARAAALLAALRAASVEPSAEACVTSHRDFYDKQVLSEADRLWVIDLDTLSRAPRMLDVGNFVAHLRLRTRQGFVSAAGAHAAREAFVGGYGDHRGSVDLPWWTAAALLRLSMIYAVRPAWTHLAPLLLDDAVGAFAGTEVMPRAVVAAEEVTA